jgi:hypothetical protein
MEVEVIQIKCWIDFGLSPKMNDLNNDIQKKADCYSVDLCGTHSYADKVDINLEISLFKANKGDIVSLLLDMETGSIEFLLNG